MVSKACAKCGDGRITKAFGRETCSGCGPVVPSTRIGDRSSKTYRNDRRWRREAEEFKRKHPYCKLCALRGIVNGERGRTGLLVDHIVPAYALAGGTIGEAFYDRSNWQVLCLDCDLRYKKPLERYFGDDVSALLEAWGRVLEDARLGSLREGTSYYG